MGRYSPEGTSNNIEKISVNRAKQALRRGDILESKVYKADSENNLFIETDNKKVVATVPKKEIEMEIGNKRTKKCALISRVGKSIKYKIKSISKDGDNTIIECSRVDAQKECYEQFIKSLKPGDIIDANITSINKIGIFCDIGCGICALLPFENFTTVKIDKMYDFYKNITELKVVVKNIDIHGRIILSHKELLGNWEEQVSDLNEGDIIKGIVTSVRDYGIFIYLKQNLVGLSEVDNSVKLGDFVTARIGRIDKQKAKIKLIILQSDCGTYTHNDKFKYIQNNGHINDWEYYPSSCDKKLTTIFN